MIEMCNIKVLVVEDNEANMVVVMALLKPAGCMILQARTAEEGISIARTETPDLILMDISLPAMDGLTATRILKEDPRTQLIPVVALTAHAMSGDENRALTAGCCGYITKPIETRTFFKQIAKFMQLEGTA